VNTKLIYMVWILIVGGFAAQGLAREGKVSAETSVPTVRVQMSLVRPLGFPNLPYYEPLYGEPRFYPQAGIEWLFLSHSRFQLGLGGSLGFSVANGFSGVAKKGKKGVPPASEIKRDPNSPSSLTLLPYRVLLSMTTYPFPNEIFGIGLWGGIEEIYFGETRTNIQPADDGDSAGRTGWSKGLVLGASLPILLAGPTSQAVRSMEIMRSHAIHLTPFYERVSALAGNTLWLIRKKDSGLDFSRQNVGLSFSFEFR
jgi:hypothetical protein